MRIAISGSHRSGKSTLIDALAPLLPEYAIVEEPYHVMVEEGHVFSHPPSLEDFEAQLERSILSSGDHGADVLLDRCPVDFLGYLAVHGGAARFELEDWLPRARAAVQTLDLLVFVPIETPDRIAWSQSDDEDESRAMVNEKLEESLLEDPFSFGVEVLVVRGSLQARVGTVMQRIHRGTV